MKWLKSTTQKAWTAGTEDKQYTIPPCDTSDNRWLRIGDDEFSTLSKLPVISSLIKAGDITVLSEEPAELKNSVPHLQVANTQLSAELETAKARIATLEAQLKNTTQLDIEQIRADAVAGVKAEYEQKLKDLDDKASGIIAEKDAKIEKLEKKLKKTEA